MSPDTRSHSRDFFPRSLNDFHLGPDSLWVLQALTDVVDVRLKYNLEYNIWLEESWKWATCNKDVLFKKPVSLEFFPKFIMPFFHSLSILFSFNHDSQRRLAISKDLPVAYPVSSGLFYPDVRTVVVPHLIKIIDRPPEGVDVNMIAISTTRTLAFIARERISRDMNRAEYWECVDLLRAEGVKAYVTTLMQRATLTLENDH